MSSKQRIAIINKDKCKPKKCGLECVKMCPSNLNGKKCIEIEDIAIISENLCIGCGICVKKCPFSAIRIINLPKSIHNCLHKFGPNQFQLHNLPILRSGHILGILGKNGIGKSTTMNILRASLHPNLGLYNDDVPTIGEILNLFKGTELTNYLRNIFTGKLTHALKPQSIEYIPRILNNMKLDVVGDVCSKYQINKEIIKELELDTINEKSVSVLSGGELQRLSIALILNKDVDVYIFDEPTSFLDIRQRIKISKMIRKLVNHKRYIIVIEHDLTILDFLSDYICVMYGQPSAYGIISKPYSVLEGINIFLDGYLPQENTRIRDESLSFKIVDNLEIESERTTQYTYPSINHQVNGFELNICEGKFNTSEIIVLLGENGCGKTTFIKLLQSSLKMSISYKPQTIKPKYKGSVKSLLQSKIGKMMLNRQFKTDVLTPLKINEIEDNIVCKLSGGEIQRVAIVLCLGKNADVYLLDEPSAFLDSEQRISVAKAIKRHILHRKACAFVVEHDLIMSSYIADKIVVFEGNAGVKCQTSQPMSIKDGMNKFLQSLGISIRRDTNNHRPRINKLDSVKDKEQKMNGTLFV